MPTVAQEAKIACVREGKVIRAYWPPMTVVWMDTPICLEFPCVSETVIVHNPGATPVTMNCVVPSGATFAMPAQSSVEL